MKFLIQDGICNKLYEADLPAYPGVDIDDYVKMCNSAPNSQIRCNILQSFALATFNSLDTIVPTHTCRK